MHFLRRERIKNKYYDFFICECGTEFSRRSDYKNKTHCGCKKTGKLGAVAKHPLYDKWSNMKKNSKKNNISISDEFLDFYKFVEWASTKDTEGLFLTRIDLDKGYSKENCDFVDKQKFDTIHNTSKKMRDAFKDKYKDADHPLKGLKRNEEENKKRESTCLKRYGVKNVMLVDDIKERVSSTNIKKYGVPCVFQTEKVKKAIVESNNKKFGYDYITQHPEKKWEIIHKMWNGERKSSSEEDEVKDFVRSLGLNCKKNVNDILENREIDIYIEDKKIGIEYCGLYWHSDKYKDRKYHWSKYRECADKGIKLITIFSDEWVSRKIQVKNHLTSMLGCNKSIYARKCKFIEVSGTDAKEFVTNQHIQPLKKSPKYSFGLTFEDYLVSVMTFDLHPRDCNQLTLSRFCTVYNTSVVGGASKLFKNSLKQLKADKIVSWSDNRWSDGNLYNKLNFYLEKELQPDYTYYHSKLGNKRIAKQNMKKSKIGCPKHVTEKEFLYEQGYRRVWDCGKKRWVYYITK